VTEKNKDTVDLMNKYGSFKKIVIYKMNDYNIFYCITSCGKLHISGSIRNGFPPTRVMLDAFRQLTDKDISNFNIMETESVLYFIEKESY
jgi:hypothetical protein